MCMLRIICFSLLVDFVDGCCRAPLKIHFNNGRTKEHFRFTTTLSPDTTIIPQTYKILHIKPLQTVFRAQILKGEVSDVYTTNNVIPTGNITAGDFSFDLTNISTSSSGYYVFQKPSGLPKCAVLYLLGKPSTPSLTKGPNPEAGGSLTFTCSCNSTTVPDYHGLSMRYDWNIGGVVNPSDPRFKFNDLLNIINISIVRKEDHNKVVSCRGTENVTGGLTSDRSAQAVINVFYGPDAIYFAPNTTNYTLRSGDHIADIACIADCNPHCEYSWNKGYTKVGAQTLSLGIVERTAAGPYTCVASRGTASIRKSLTINVIDGPDNIHFAPNITNYTVRSGDYLADIICMADCYPRCTYAWNKGFTKVGVQTLSLGIVERTLAGTYNCVASLGTASIRKSLTINVMYGPDDIHFAPNTTNYTVRSGDYLAYIVCMAECNPRCTYAWNKGFNIVAAQILSLDFVERTAAGTYTCVASQGTASIRKGLTVDVMYGPDNIHFAPNITNYTARSGDYLADIVCMADCNPRCTYAWNKGFTKVGAQNLLLGIVDKTEAGTYTCVASQGTAAIRKNLIVNVIGDSNAVDSNKTGKVVGGSIGGFVGGALLSILVFVLFLRFRKMKAAKKKELRKTDANEDVYYNVAIGNMSELRPASASGIKPERKTDANEVVYYNVASGNMSESRHVSTSGLKPESCFKNSGIYVCQSVLPAGPQELWRGVQREDDYEGLRRDSSEQQYEPIMPGNLA